MERCIKQYNMECIKVAMLKHEETFRQQVDELHRLYRVQKLLMNDVKRAELKRHRSNRERSNTEESGSVMAHVEEDSDLELTLAIGSRQRKKKETSFTSDSETTFSSSSDESSGVKSNSHEWRLVNVQEQVREDRVKGSPCLFQCLSLNMT